MPYTAPSSHIPFTTEHSVLDHGWVKLRNIAGPTRRQLEPNGLVLRPFDADDIDVAQAARMSFEQMDSLRTYAADMKLTSYLMENEHMGPFEQIVVWLEMKLPIFVARQFVTHRTARRSEVSARYKELPADWYIPDIQQVRFAVGDKKQGGRAIDLTSQDDIEAAVRFREELNKDCAASYARYQNAIADNIAMELARMHLHVNHYTHWLWQMDFRNLMHFLALRVDSHAQWESQQYGKAIVSLLEPVIPGLMDIWKGEGE